MEQKTSIELTCGPGPALRWCSSGVWLFALLVLLGLSGRIPGLLTLAGALILLYEAPWWRLRAPPGGRIRLHREGGFESARARGAWLGRGWTTRWLTVLFVETGSGRSRRIIAAWRNDPDDYRVLRTWLSFPARPSEPAGWAGRAANGPGS